MSNVQDAVLGFKNKRGSNGLPANPLLRVLATKDDGKQFYQQNLSHTVFKQRMDFVAREADQFFSKSDIERMHPSPLDNGGESLVLDCNNDHVLKIRRGQPYAACDFQDVLQPVQSGYSADLDINYDIFPKVQKQGARYDQILSLVMKSAVQGFIIHDPLHTNFGWIKRKENEPYSLILIDYGAMHKGTTLIKNVLQAGYVSAKMIGKPLYEKMPFVHEPWRAFKANVKSMLGYPSPNDPLIPFLNGAQQNHAENTHIRPQL